MRDKVSVVMPDIEINAPNQSDSILRFYTNTVNLLPGRIGSDVTFIFGPPQEQNTVIDLYRNTFNADQDGQSAPERIGLGIGHIQVCSNNVFAGRPCVFLVGAQYKIGLVIRIVQTNENKGGVLLFGLKPVVVK
jgi:hypothetical protein